MGVARGQLASLHNSNNAYVYIRAARSECGTIIIETAYMDLTSNFLGPHYARYVLSSET